MCCHKSVIKVFLYIMNFSNCVTKLCLNVMERVLPSKRRCFWTYQNIMCYKITFWMSKHVTRRSFACIEMQCQDHILNVSKCVAKTAFLLTGFYLIFVALTSKQSYFTLVLFFFHFTKRGNVWFAYALPSYSKAKQSKTTIGKPRHIWCVASCLTGRIVL